MLRSRAYLNFSLLDQICNWCVSCEARIKQR